MDQNYLDCNMQMRMYSRKMRYHISWPLDTWYASFLCGQNDMFIFLFLFVGESGTGSFLRSHQRTNQYLLAGTRWRKRFAHLHGRWRHPASRQFHISTQRSSNSFIPSWWAIMRHVFQEDSFSSFFLSSPSASVHFFFPFYLFQSVFSYSFRFVLNEFRRL